MNLEQILLSKIENLGKVTWKRMFGMQMALIGGKMMGGYRIVDENVIYVMLILSPKGFESAIESGYLSKFDFGKTWVEGEITSEDDLSFIEDSIKDSYEYVKNKKK